MKKFYMAIVSSIAITAVIGCLILIFIVAPATASNDRLTVTKVYATNGINMYEIVDDETGVCYLWVSYGYKGGITPMYYQNGMLKVKR